MQYMFNQFLALLYPLLPRSVLETPTDSYYTVPFSGIENTELFMKGAMSTRHMHKSTVDK